jgi:hypothetical protein
MFKHIIKVKILQIIAILGPGNGQTNDKKKSFHSF